MIWSDSPSPLMKSERSIGYGAWLAALGLALLMAAWSVRPQRANAQERIRDNDYSLDLAQGLAIGSVQQVGMGNAFTAIANSLGGVPFNPAAAATRGINELKWIEPRGDFAISFPGAFGQNDFYNNGLGMSRGLNIDDSILVGGGFGIQIGSFGTSLLIDSQSYVVNDADGEALSTVVLQSYRLSGGFGVLNGDIVLGASLLISRSMIADRSLIQIIVPTYAREMLHTIEPGMEVGALYKPDGKRFRIGVAAVSQIRSRLVPAGSTDIVEANGYIVPTFAVRPWEVRLGVAYQFGRRPFNMRYQAPPNPTEWIRARERRARCERLVRQLRAEEARGIPPIRTFSSTERAACPHLPIRPADASFWEEEQLIRAEERANREARVNEERARIKHQRWIDYEMLPRRYLLVSADLVVIGGVSNSVGIDGFLDQELRLHRGTPSFIPRVGVEGEPWRNRLKLRAGFYLEPGRNVGVSPRPHFTAGFDLNVLTLGLGGPVNPYAIRVGGKMDVARDYSELGLTVGFWH